MSKGGKGNVDPRNAAGKKASAKLLRARRAAAKKREPVADSDDG